MSIIDSIYHAGVVGCGGAGFPTHVKLKGQVEHLILNGAECEPLLRTDRYLMINKAKEIVEAADLVAKELGAKECTIALKAAYKKETAALEAAIAQTGAAVVLHKMDSFYPAGDEQVIVYEVTGRVVPPAGIPLDVGCVVSNVATMVCVYEANLGIPFTYKYLTVTGKVAKPTVLRVPVGTSFERCIELAGGALEEQFFVVSGGPMMGAPITMEQAQKEVVTKTTSGILVLPADGFLSMQDQIDLRHTMNRARSACIQCSFCTDLCPRYLLGHPLQPHRIMRKLAMSPDLSSMLDDDDVRQAQICCECGICELYACPMGLQPRKVNALLKAEYGKAGIRYQRQDEEWQASPERSGRQIPTRRAAARVGVLEWYDTNIETLTEDTPAHIELPLKMHIGAPAHPVVAAGESVTAGQLVAACPQGKLGANIHTGIAGVVVSIDGRIVIEGGK